MDFIKEAFEKGASDALESLRDQQREYSKPGSVSRLGNAASNAALSGLIGGGLGAGFGGVAGYHVNKHTGKGLKGALLNAGLNGLQIGGVSAGLGGLLGAAMDPEQVRQQKLLAIKAAIANERNR